MAVKYHFYILLFTLANAESDFKRSCRNLPQQSAYISGLCVVLHQTQHKNRTAASWDCAKRNQGILAVIHSIEQINKLSALLELQVPAWCGLMRDPQDPDKWLHETSENGLRAQTPNPPWDVSLAPNPDPSGGDGVLLGESGLQNDEYESEHPYLCQFSENAKSMNQFRLKKKGFKPTSDEAFDQWSVPNIHACSTACADRANCRSFGYSALSSECHLYLVPPEGLQLNKTDTGFEIFERRGAESDCVDKTDCEFDHSHILIISGQTNKNIEVFYPKEPANNQIVHTLPSFLQDAVAELYEGRVLIAGGGVSTCLWLDPRTNTISPAPSMSTVRRHHTSALLNGAMVVCGGHDSTSGLSSCEQFINNNNNWTSMPSLTVARWGLGMVNLAGKLYAAGGRDPADTFVVFERFDPGSNQWTRLNDLPDQRFYAGMAVLKDTIYQCGSHTAAVRGTCIKYNVASDSWTPIGSLKTPRYQLEMLVFDKRLFAIGGFMNDAANPQRAIEVYNPTTDSWEISANELIQTRVQFAAVVV